jgi:hypothetical protein
MFESTGAACQAESAEVRAEIRTLRPAGGWNPESFAREQIRGLVRQVFFSHAARPVRQVVFSTVDAETDVRGICRQVGEALALETVGSVAVAGSYPRVIHAGEIHERSQQEITEQDRTKQATKNESAALRQAASRLRGNLWLVPPAASSGDTVPTASLHSHLCDLRREFEYSIVECPPAGASHEAAAMAQLADGIILVLSAQRTRRATALKVMRTLEAVQARILGTVLSDRVFPIPERIYRRL